MSWLVDPTQRILNGALDGLMARQSVVSANLANLDTPGYQPMAVDFESTLQQELQAGQSDGGASSAPMVGPSADLGMRTTDPRHLNASGTFGAPAASAQPAVGSLRNDGNQVDLETEMAALTDTQLRFEAVTQMTAGKYAMLDQAITGGR